MAFASSSTSRPLGGYQSSMDTTAWNAGSSQRAPVAPKPATLDLPALQAASRVLQDQFVKDAQIIPDLGELLSIPGGQLSAAYTIFPGDHRIPFQKRKHIGFPPTLWEHFQQSSDFESSMGILPEIERAWISLDHKLFLWDYVEGQALSSFVEQPDVIKEVALVKPKPGVFIDEITSLLVICTTSTVLLLGVSSPVVVGSDTRTHREVKLYATDISVSTGEVEMTSVIGMGDGRIFMSGSDGHLYELHYQEKEQWFKKKIQLINHTAGGLTSFLPLLQTPASSERILNVVADTARGCFYTLGEHNTISMWKPEADKTLRKIQTLSNLLQQAQNKAPGTQDLAQNFSIISLHVIHVREAKSGVQLLAVSANGARLYFAPVTSFGYAYGYSAVNIGDPKQLQLVHVRLPPTTLPHPDEQYRPQNHAPHGGIFGAAAPAPPSSPPLRINGLTTTLYMDGLLLGAQKGDVEERDFLLGISPDLSAFGTLGQSRAATTQAQLNQNYIGGNSLTYPGHTPNRPPLTEQATWLYMEGTIRAIVNAKPGSSASSSSLNVPTPTVINELATEFSEPHKEIALMTTIGISLLVKRRVVDYLQDAIEEVLSDGNVQPILDFRDSFGRDQTCAMLLPLACGNTFLSGDKSSSYKSGSLLAVSSESAGLAKQAFFDLGEKPLWVDRAYSGDGQNVLFSGRREAVAIYLARLVRPVWRSAIAKPSSFGLLVPNIPDLSLVTVQKNLYALKEFLDNNPQLFGSSPGDHLGSRSTNDQEAWKVEQTSAAQLQTLLSRTIEAISFVLLLMDYNLGELVASCDLETQKILSNLTVEELITTQNGLHASRALVNVIINRQLGQQISVDAVSEVLQQRCGSFCSPDDVMLYKAQENVRRAVEVKDQNERQVLLGESLRLFSKAAPVIEFEKLREICGDYQQLSYAKGAVELPLHCAKAVDTDESGYQYWLAGKPEKDPRSEALERRLRCYDLVLDSLSVFGEHCNVRQPKSGMHNGAIEVRDFAYNTAFASEDPVFHSHLYTWMIENGMADTLLEIRPPYLEAHLEREPSSVTNYQLLWQLHVKEGSFLRAAQVLATLAQSTSFDLSLESRLEFLTLAVSNAKSQPVAADAQHETAITFLSELEDQLEVTQVQLETYNALVPKLPELSEEDRAKVELLQRGLLNITELYQLYAEPFNLSSVKLLILHVSQHRDDAVVKPIWNEIFEKVEEDKDFERAADIIASTVTGYARRFYPSESALPLRHVASLLVRFALSHKGVRPYGWVPRILKDGGVPYSEIWDLLHEMYESQVPPFNDQTNIQDISSDIAILLKDWVEDAQKPQSIALRSDLPVDQIDRAITKYLEELTGQRPDTRRTFEEVRRNLRRHW